MGEQDNNRKQGSSSEKAESVQQSRDQIIVRTSIIGILANILLAAFKAAVGLLANSIAVVLDAVNNLSDALSSVITIIGTKLAGRKPDKKHPLGYGRVEYLSAMVVAALVLYAGITSAVESVKKIIHPESPDYSVVTLVVIASAVIVKLLLGRYVKHVGEKVNSGALVASGSDASFDAILSFSVLVSALIFMFFHINLEAYVGIVIAVFIIRAGLEMLTDTLDELLGKRMDREFMEEIRSTICEDEQVMGAYDLILHSYGPDHYIGSVHVEVPDTLTAEDIDRMDRRIATRVLEKHGILLTGIGIYAVNTRDDEAHRMHVEIARMVSEHKGVIQTHGFYVDREKKIIGMDVILDFDTKDRKALYDHLLQDIQTAYPDYQVNLQLDLDI